MNQPDLHNLGLRDLISLAIPSVVFSVLRHGYRLVDQYWLQFTSTESQAAVGSASFVLILFSGIYLILSAGVSPLIAHAVGAKRPHEIKRLLGNTLTGGLILFVLTAGLGFVLPQTLSTLLGLSGATGEAATIYIKYFMLFALPMVLSPIVDQCFIAMGNARVPMILHGLILTTNMCLTPLFIQVLQLDVFGAILSSALSTSLGTAIGLIILIQNVGLQCDDLRIRGELRKILDIGLPMSLGTISYALVYWGLLFTSVSPLGPHVNAALGIGFSALEGVTWPCFHGLSMAVSSFVGRTLGAQAPQQTWRIIKLALLPTSLCGLAASLIFFFVGHTLTGLFTEDPMVHEAATEYALIIAASQIFVAWESFTEGVLGGAGDTKTIFWFSMPFNISRIPLCWLFAFPMGFGAAGIWWAINITTYLKTILKAWALYRGKWITILDETQIPTQKLQ